MLFLNSKEAISYILKGDIEIVKKSNITLNFKWGEVFVHRTNSEIISCAKSQSYVFDHLVLMANFMQQFRAYIGNKGINITSGWRGVDFNNSLPDASSTSYHIDGLAFDFNVSGLTPRQTQKNFVGFAKQHGCEWGKNISFTHMSYPQVLANTLKTITKRSKVSRNGAFEEFIY